MVDERHAPSINRAESVPLYYQVYQYILGEVVPHHRIDEPLPSDDEVAASTQVSKGTVRLAFNLLEREGILYRIPGRGTFLHLDYLIRLKKYRIGVVLPAQEFSDKSILIQNWVHHMEIINGLLGLAVKLNTACTLLAPESLQGNHHQEFDGFILYPGIPDAEVELGGKPLVHLGYDMDFLSGFSRMTAHALASGVRSPAYIGFAHEGRLEAVNAELVAAGLAPLAEERIVRCQGTAADGFEACAALLSRGVAFDAILCSTDLRALGVLRKLKEAGRRIPDDVAVYGLDGIPQGDTCDPALTTVAFDWQYPGRRALEQIRAKLDGLKVPPYEAPQGVLVERESSRRLPS